MGLCSLCTGYARFVQRRAANELPCRASSQLPSGLVVCSRAGLGAALPPRLLSSSQSFFKPSHPFPRVMLRCCRRLWGALTYRICRRWDELDSKLKMSAMTTEALGQRLVGMAPRHTARPVLWLWRSEAQGNPRLLPNPSHAIGPGTSRDFLFTSYRTASNISKSCIWGYNPNICSSNRPAH